MKKFKCDMCNCTHELDQSKIKEKQYYIPPYSCFQGDEWVHDYYYFTCNCGRDIKVDDSDIENLNNILIDTSPHVGVCLLNVEGIYNTYQNDTKQWIKENVVCLPNSIDELSETLESYLKYKLKL